MSDRIATQGQMEATLKTWGAKLDTLKAKANQAGADSKAELNHQIESLGTQRDTIQHKLDDLKGSSDDAWESMRTGMEGAWNEVSSAFDQAMSKFK